MQGEKVANVPEEEILDRLLEECREFQAKVERGEAKLGEKKVDILPPDPIGELGSGWEKVRDGERRRACPCRWWAVHPVHALHHDAAQRA